jgi:nucleoside-diphosphate-sugar epimerase
VKVLVPGGCGYIGAMLVGWLLVDGHHVTVYDTQWFGTGHLPDNPNLTLIKGDVRDTLAFGKACCDQEAVIYLASISNNDLCVREPELALSVNFMSFLPAVRAARLAGVGHFIYASSVAAYGSTQGDAMESSPLVGETPYSMAKAHCEEILFMEQRWDFICTATRMASVCGYSVHQRLDLTVNRMVHSAMRNGFVQVNGGAQKRSHIHIQDACRAYRMLLTAENVQGQAFNFVAENSSVMDTAKTVAGETGAEIRIGPATDDRSYTVDGTKALKVLGFRAEKTVRHAVKDLKVRFEAKYWPDADTNPVYQNMAYGLA